VSRPREIALFSHAVGTSPRSGRLRATKRAGASGAGSGRRRRLVQLALVFVGCVLLFDALVGEKGLVDLMRANRAHQSLQHALHTARRDNETLREEIQRLRDDPAAIEDIARRELGLIKPGEKLFMVRDVERRDPDLP
jgi:cell division protein FtsB